jgi:hypothetical protein
MVGTKEHLEINHHIILIDRILAGLNLSWMRLSWLQRTCSSGAFFFCELCGQKPQTAKYTKPAARF